MADVVMANPQFNYADRKQQFQYESKFVPQHIQSDMMQSKLSKILKLLIAIYVHAILHHFL
jgi:hypothetical protein